MEELWLDNKRVELPVKKVSQTYQINDLAELRDRQLNYTNRFTVPPTPNNIKVMDYLNTPGNNSSKPYVRVPARFVAQGIELMAEGYANVNKGSSKGYDINIYDGNATLYETLKGRRISQLNWSDLNHTLNLASYKASLTNTEGYIYALGQFGVSSLGTVNIERQAPSVFIKTIWDKIFEGAGFTYEGDIFSDSNFLSEVITPTKGYEPTNSGETETSLGSIQSNTVSRNEVETDPVFYDDKFGISSSGGLTQSSISNNGVDIAFDGVLKMVINSNHTLTNGYASLVVRKNGTNILSVSLEDGTNINKTSEFSLVVANGDRLEYYLSTSSFEPSDPELEFYLLDASCSFTADFDEVTGGQFVDFAEIMPDTSQIDFIKDVMQSYGLMFQTKRKSNHYIFKDIESLLNDRDSAEDWSNKVLDIGTETYRFGSYAQENYMRYNYEENVEEPTHDGRLDIDNENLPAEKTLFSSIYTISIQQGSRNLQPIYLVPIWELDDDNVTVLELESAMRKFRINRVNETLNFNKTGVTGSDSFTGDVPYLSLVNLDYDFYIGNYYPALNRALNRQNKRTLTLELSIIDVYNLDFFKLKYFKQLGQYFYLNKVSNYVVGRPVQCEFVQAVGVTVNQPPSQVGNKAISLIHGTTKSLNLMDFTDTTPPYSDPEFDQPERIKFISGFDTEIVLKNNGVAITSETIVEVATMNLTLEEQGNIIPEHTADIVFSIQSFNSTDYSTDTGELNITVPERVNYAPVAEAGANQNLVYDSSDDGSGAASVYGGSSYDPNQDTLTYLWTVDNSLPSRVVLSNENQATATLTGTNLNSVQNNYVIQMRLRVTDPFGLFDENTCEVTLKDLNPNFE